MRLKDWRKWFSFSLDVNDPELMQLAQKHREFTERVSNSDHQVLKRFCSHCLRDASVFEVKLSQSDPQSPIAGGVDFHCCELFSNYETIVGVESCVTLSRQSVQSLTNNRKCDSSTQGLSQGDFVIIGRSANPRDSMLIQPIGSSEIFELSEFESLHDVLQSPTHVARFKNILVWVASSWYRNQDDPELEPFAVDLENS